MVEIECLKCGKVFTPHQCIDTNNYDGEVICTNCKALLHIKLVKGKLQKRKVVDKGKITFTADERAIAARELREAQEEERKLIEEDAPKPPVSTDDKPLKPALPNNRT